MNKGRVAWLDGARGFAALAVMLKHFGFASADASYCVDFFFVLSGFVLSRRYESDLMASMSPLRFMRERLSKLGPLYLIGTALVFLAYVPVGITPDVVGAAGAAAFMVPYLGTGSPYLFPLNPPAWSLFFELVVNLLYVLNVRRLNDRALIASIAIGLSLAAVDTHLTNGFGRAMAGFAFGALLYRKTPEIGGLAVPERLRKHLIFLGTLSYPLYITHWALVVACQHHGLPWGAGAVLSIPLAYAALKLDGLLRRHSGKAPELMNSIVACFVGNERRAKAPIATVEVAVAPEYRRHVGSASIMGARHGKGWRKSAGRSGGE